MLVYWKWWGKLSYGVIKAFVISVAEDWSEVCMFGNSRCYWGLYWDGYKQTVHFSWHIYSPQWVGKGFRLWKVCTRGAQINSMNTSCKKMWDVNCVSHMGQRHGSVLQILASPILQKHLLKQRNLKLNMLIFYDIVLIINCE